MENSIDKKMGVIRGYVNEPRRKAHLLLESGKFNQLIACLDTIEDAEMAICSYKSSDEFNFGNGYLQIYGLMQAFILQQDAVRFLGDSLMNYEINIIAKYPELKNIRNLRNLTIGHPTKNHSEIFTQISRAELEKSNIIALLWSEKGGCDRKEINIINLIEDQSKCIEEELDVLINMLKEDEEAHKAKWSNEKLIELFSDNVDYCLQKMYASTEDDLCLAKGSVVQIKRITERVKSRLKERLVHLDWNRDFDFTFTKLEKLIARYEEILATKKNGEIEFEIFTDGIKKYFKRLMDSCGSLDEYYSTTEE